MHPEHDQEKTEVLQRPICPAKQSKKVNPPIRGQKSETALSAQREFQRFI